MLALRLTRRFFLDGHTFDADEVISVTEERARQLIQAGVGVRYTAPATPPPSGKPAKRAKKS